jgi:hypothetical protein
LTEPTFPPFQPPPTFRDSDLIGRWELISPIYNTEILTLTADQHFIQRYDVFGDPRYHYEGRGTWWVERRPSGCVYVHLDGMRYFYGGEALAASGNRLAPDGKLMTFLDKCEDRSITMPDKVILLVVNQPRRPRGIDLLFPKSGRDDTDVMMKLTGDETGQPVPTATPLPR